MVDRQVEFLDLVGLLLRHDNSDICELRELSACLSCETDNFKSLRLCGHCGVHHILRVSGGADSEEHIPCFSVAVYLLCVREHSIHIVCECGGEAHMICEGDGWEPP